MSEDKQAQAEAWVRKPRRIIQNQLLIQILMMLVLAVPIPLGGFIFWMVFCAAPAIVIPSIVIVWVLSSVSFIVMRMHIERQNKRS